MAVGEGGGFHIADAFVEIHADKDPIERELRDLGTTVGPAGESGGKNVGKRVGKGMGDGADGKGTGKRIGDEVDGALGPRSEKSGKDSGDKLSRGMSMAIVRNSPLIVAGIAGALSAGAPAAFAGATALFAGIGIAAAVQSDQVKSAWKGTWNFISDTLKGESGTMQTELTHLAGVTADKFAGMRESIGSAINYSVPLVDRLANSVLNAADNALPGLEHALDNAGPAINGLGNLVESVGSGLGQFFDTISQHSGAAGSAFTALGSIVQSLLRILGDLLGQGSELARIVLPALASVLNVVAGVLDKIAPVLPVIAAGFGAWRIVSSLTGPLTTLSAKLQTVAADGGKLTTSLAGTAASGVSKLGAALPALGIAIGLVTAVMAEMDQQSSEWADALLKGGSAADQAREKMDELQAAVEQQTTGWRGVVNGLGNTTLAWQLAGKTVDDAKKKYQDMLAAMDPVTRAQTLEKQALNDLNQALHDHGEGSASAIVAEEKYKDAADRTKEAEAEEERAIHGVTQAMLDQADEALAAADSGIAYRRAQVETTQAAKDFTQAVKEHKAALNDNSDASLAYEEALLRQAEAAGKAAADASGLTDKMDLQRVSDQATLAELLKLRDEYGSNFPASLQATIDRLQGIGVTADTSSGQLDALGNKKVTPTIGPAVDNLAPQVGIDMNALFDLGKAHPVPSTDLEDNPLRQKYQTDLGFLTSLDSVFANPTAGLNPGPFEQILGMVNGQLGTLAHQQPTPTANLNTGPLQTQTNFSLGQLYNLGAQRPTPSVQVNDRATGVLGSISSWLNSLQGRVVTTYVNTIGRNVMGAGGILSPDGGGGMIHAFAGGGMEKMRANFATVVPAGNLRVIGDRTDVDEFFIPDDKSQRSQSILAEAASRMGKMLVSAGHQFRAGSASVTPNMDGGATLSIGQLHVHIDGTFDFTKPDTIRTLAQKLDTALAELHRGRS